MTLAEQLRAWRRTAGLSTKEAGERLGISPRTIEGIEQGRPFRYERVLRLAIELLKQRPSSEAA